MLRQRLKRHRRRELISGRHILKLSPRFSVGGGIKRKMTQDLKLTWFGLQRVSFGVLLSFSISSSVDTISRITFTSDGSSVIAILKCPWADLKAGGTKMPNQFKGSQRLLGVCGPKGFGPRSPESFKELLGLSSGGAPGLLAS